MLNVVLGLVVCSFAICTGVEIGVLLFDADARIVADGVSVRIAFCVPKDRSRGCKTGFFALVGLCYVRI